MVYGTEDGRCWCGSAYLISRAASKLTSNKNAQVDSVGLARLDRNTGDFHLPTPLSSLRHEALDLVAHSGCLRDDARRHRPCPRDLVFHVFPLVST